MPQMPMGASIPTPTNMTAIPPPRYHYRLIPRTPAPPEKFMKTAWLAGKHPSPLMDLRGTAEVVDAWRAGKHPLTSADPNTSEEAALPLGKLYPSSASQATNSPPQMVTTPSLLHRESAVNHCRIQENAILALTPRLWSDASTGRAPPHTLTTPALELEPIASLRQIQQHVRACALTALPTSPPVAQQEGNEEEFYGRTLTVTRPLLEAHARILHGTPQLLGIPEEHQAMSQHQPPRSIDQPMTPPPALSTRRTLPPQIGTSQYGHFSQQHRAALEALAQQARRRRSLLVPQVLEN